MNTSFLRPSALPTLYSLTHTSLCGKVFLKTADRRYVHFSKKHYQRAARCAYCTRQQAVARVAGVSKKRKICAASIGKSNHPSLIKERKTTAIKILAAKIKILAARKKTLAAEKKTLAAGRKALAEPGNHNGVWPTCTSTPLSMHSITKKVAAARMLQLLPVLCLA